MSTPDMISLKAAREQGYALQDIVSTLRRMRALRQIMRWEKYCTLKHAERSAIRTKAAKGASRPYVVAYQADEQFRFQALIKHMSGWKLDRDQLNRIATGE